MLRITLGILWTPYKYIACARSVSENVGLLLKNSYVVSDNFDLVLFLPLSHVDMQLQWIFGTQKGGSGPHGPPPLDPPMIYAKCMCAAK